MGLVKHLIAGLSITSAAGFALALLTIIGVFTLTATNIVLSLLRLFRITTTPNLGWSTELWYLLFGFAIINGYSWYKVIGIEKELR